MKNNVEKACYQVEDLCDVIGISRAKAYQLVHQNGFPTVKIGRRIVIPKVRFERWIEEQCS